MKVEKSLSSSDSSMDEVSIAWEEIHCCGPTRVLPFQGRAFSSRSAVSTFGLAKYSSSRSEIFAESASSAFLLFLCFGGDPYFNLFLLVSRAAISWHPLGLEVLELPRDVGHLDQDPVPRDVVDAAAELYISGRVFFHLVVDWSGCSIDLVHVILVGQLLQRVQSLLEEVWSVVEHEVRHHLDGHCAEVFIIAGKRCVEQDCLLRREIFVDHRNLVVLSCICLKEEPDFFKVQ